MQFPDFVEKQRALVSLFDQSLVSPVSAGERAFFMAEQSAADQVFRQRGAIDDDKRFIGPGRIAMNGPGEQFAPKLPTG